MAIAFTATEKLILTFIILTIMLAMGLGLSLNDVKTTLRSPKSFVIGLLTHVVAMPLLGVAMIAWAGLPPEWAVGFMLLACAPTGSTSNVFVYFGKGNVSLSVTLTAVSTVLAPLTIPLLFYLVRPASQESALVVPLDNVITTTLMMLVPLAVGMALAKKWPTKKQKWEQRAAQFGLLFVVIFACVYLPRAWGDLRQTESTYVGLAVLLPLGGLIIGYLVSTLLRLASADRIAVAFTTGVQNGPFTVATVALSFPEVIALKASTIPIIYGGLVILLSFVATAVMRALGKK